MANAKNQKKWREKYSFPSISILKEKNDQYKSFVSNKGYNSLNDYFNTVIEYDLSHNIIPCKADINSESQPHA